MNLPILGIIAGKGGLPEEIINIYTLNGGDCVIASIEQSKNYENIPCRNFSIGSVGAIISYFEDSNVQNIVAVGGVNRPDFKSLKLDKEGVLLMARIMKNKFLGDDNILAIITDYINKKGFNLISPLDIMALYNKDYIQTKKKPSTQSKIDIELGESILIDLGKLDVGQSVIVCNGYTLGIEAAEGTDNLIIRCGSLRKQDQGGVLVKKSKISQDIRSDVPVVGPDTIINLVKHNFSGLAIEKRGVIIVKPQKTLRLLDKNQLFLEYI